VSSVLASSIVLAASTAKSKGNSSAIFIVLLIAAVAIYFFFLRPRTQRQKQVRDQVRQASVGDEIATIGGLVGTIVSEDGDRVTVSTGNGTELVFLRQAIGRKIEPATPDAGADTADHGPIDGTPPGFDPPSGSDATPTSEEPDAK
jgi:preprotein translocase subunit YajC